MKRQLTYEDFERMKNNKGNIPEFYDVVKDNLDITDNLKSDKLMSYAYQKGHSTGYYEVYLIAMELVELIR
jgi:hypothetical protein